MVAIKNFEKPNACYQCELLDEHGVCSITGDDIFADCPLVEIGTCKDCKNGFQTSFCSSSVYGCEKHKGVYRYDFYCKDFEKRGSEDD